MEVRLLPGGLFYGGNMLEREGDIWELADCGTLVVTTNPVISYSRSHQGEVVMGRGIALQCKQRFPHFPEALAARIRAQGNIPHDMGSWVTDSRVPWFRILTLPTKHHWKDKADHSLIKMSLLRIATLVEDLGITGPIFTPRPGCGNGGLDWRTVKPYCAQTLSDQFVVVDYKPVQGELL